MTTVISYSCRVGQSRDRCHPTGAILAAHPAGSSYAGLVTDVQLTSLTWVKHVVACHTCGVDTNVKKTNILV